MKHEKMAMCLQERGIVYGIDNGAADPSRLA